LSAGSLGLRPIILATQEAGIRRILVQSQSGDTISKNLSQKIGLVEWLKVKALSSSPSTTKKKRKKINLSYLK
jgi:hypothetical protein